jgi:hypothetical protein
VLVPVPGPFATLSVMQDRVALVTVPATGIGAGF